MRPFLPITLRGLAFGLALVVTTSTSWGQNPISPPQNATEDYSKGRSHFPNPIAPYQPREVAAPNLTNSPRIASLVHDGKLMLSLNDAVALTLENNLDIAISRYNLDIADTDILRTAAGANTLGVNTGIVQNTPGGGTGGLSGTVGSGTGGTSVGTAGAGTGTNGLVSSTLGIGSTIPSFDPIVSGTLQIDRNHTFATNYQAGVPIINTNTATANFGYTQGLHYGTEISASFNNAHTTSNNTSPLLTPSITSNLQFRLTQPLLQGRGKLPNTRYIRIASNNRQISQAAFQLQVITTVDQVETLYWNLVYAFENVKVNQDAVAYAQKILTDDQTQVKYGTLQPVQVANAQSVLANNQQTLILAQTNLQLQQLLMKNAFSRVFREDVIRDAEVVPTSTMQMPTEEPVLPTEPLVAAALAKRAELAESQIDLSTRELSGDAVANALLPIVNPSAYYGGSGLGGNLNPALPICLGTVTIRCFNPSKAPPPFRHQTSVGYGSTLGQLFDSTATDKGAAVTMDFTLGNREAQANQMRSQLELAQARVRLQQLQNQVRIEVRNAQFDVQQNRASVKAAQEGVDYAQKNLYAEQRKLQVGVGTPDAVLQNQSAMTTARGNLLSALAAYQESQVELDRATGLLLEHAGIQIGDALKGQVITMPNLPHVVPAEAEPAAPPPIQ